MQEEIWKDIKDYEGLYQVSNLGRVKSLKREIIRNKYGRLPVPEKILSLEKTTSSGYKKIWIYKDKKGKEVNVHRLVAEAFLKQEYPNNIVNHLNGIKTDNRLENLEWTTYSKNGKHSYKVGLSKAHNSKVVIDNETGIFYDSISEAARAKGYFPGTLRAN